METINQIAELGKLDISGIAYLIKQDWKKVYFGAVPYLDAMTQMSKVSDNFGLDDGRSVINYFLANSSGYRGSLAKAIKAELKKRLKAR